MKGAYLTAETHLKQLIDYEECQWYRRSAGTTKRVHHEAKFRVSCRLGDCWCVGVRAASERIRRHIQLWAVAEAQDLHESGANPATITHTVDGSVIGSTYGVTLTSYKTQTSGTWGATPSGSKSCVV